MDKKTRVYVDTAAFIAFRDRSDSFHSLFIQLFSNPPSLITTSLVIAEGHGWFLKRYDQARALQFVSFIESLKPLEIIPVGTEVLSGSYGILRKFSDQDLTLADAAGLWLMKKNHIATCWSTDRHLRLMGASLAIDR